MSTPTTASSSAGLATTAAQMDIDDIATRHEHGDLDESLYSRQLYVLGHEAMRAMSKSSVLLVGLSGLGIEIAKNVALAGVRSVTLHDPTPATLSDLGSQFFIREDDVKRGTRRDKASEARLKELNSYVPIKVLQDGWKDAVNKGEFQVVVLIDQPLSVQLEVNDATHAQNIKFISAETRGLFASVFCDFGNNFPVVDPNGEEPQTGIIASVTIDDEGLVTCLDDKRHGLEDGDFVTFSEVKGTEELNGCEPRKVTVKGPYTFTIGSTANLTQYISGGIFTQVKLPKLVSFLPLRESLLSPSFLLSDFAKFTRPHTLHIGFQALSTFVSSHSRLPAPRSPTDAAELLKLAKAVPGFDKDGQELEEDILKELSFQAQGQVPPMNAVIGGFVGQEVLKACSGKFGPTIQHLYFDSLESLPDDLTTLTESSCAPTGSRYDGQIAVFGTSFLDKVHSNRQFLVGAGAIGCEMLKNWALMGLGTQDAEGAEAKGRKKGTGIWVTDLDTIEKSNLNRQFLFRPKDLGQAKSGTAAKAVAEMNRELEGRIWVGQDPVGVDTEATFGDDFFDQIDGVTNALDNVAARQYMDRRCVYYRKPLLESGTLATKANVQVVLPDITESYSSTQDPPEQSFPMCTVKSFPNIIEHCIAWAKEKFEDTYTKPAEAVNNYLRTANFVETLRQQGGQSETLKNVAESLNVPIYFEECIEWARKEWEGKFHNEIADLVEKFPADAQTSEGLRFWSGPKRCPKPLQFDRRNPQHLKFVIAAANLRAFNYGLRGNSDPAVFEKVLDSMVLAEYVPNPDAKIQVKDDEPVETDASIDPNAEFAALAAALPDRAKFAGYEMKPVEFEKDDDTNFHIAYITAAANLRAMNYGIATTDEHRTKFVAGRIIPAIATTTALATGLVCLELYKLIDGKKDVEKYKNGFVNLALPFFGFSEPILAPKQKYGETEWTLWSRFDIEENLTLREFIAYFKEKHKLDVSMVSSGVSMLFGFMTLGKKREERLAMTMSELIETVSKKPIPPHVKKVVIEIIAEDEDGEDVDTPWVSLRIRK